MKVVSDKVFKKQLEKELEYKDGKLYWKRSRLGTSAGLAGSKNPNLYVKMAFFGRNCLAHRLIFLMHHGYLPKQIDHINRNKNDNRIENLRAATDAENKRNHGMKYNNNSGYKGVRKSGKNWAAQIRGRDGKHCWLGTFKTKEEAALKYNEAAIKFHGEFAYMNIIKTSNGVKK